MNERLHDIPLAEVVREPGSREELFGPEYNEPLLDSMGVDRTLWWLKRIAADKAVFQTQLEEAQAFYARKMAQLDQTAEFAKARIEAFLKAGEKDKLVVPNGTVFFQTTNGTIWPEDEVIVAFVRENAVEGVISEQTVTKIDKAVLKKYIKESGRAPMGFETPERTKLAFRLAEAR